MRKAFQGTEHSSTICWTPWRAVAKGQKGLWRAAAPCYRFVPGYGPHQSASTVICASFPPLSPQRRPAGKLRSTVSASQIDSAFRKFGSAGRGQGWGGMGTGTGTNHRPLLQAALRGATRWPFIRCPSTHKTTLLPVLIGFQESPSYRHGPDFTDFPSAIW